ncbi:MAG: Uma2 family endonuclease [Microcoleaceae cyanobacterium]
MLQSITKISLSEFLAQPNIEASPAWELIEGRAIQKIMPTLFHSRLQRNLVNYINQRTGQFEVMQFEAIQELRCIVPPYSPVPDIAIVECERLPSEDGPLNGAPDWLIEIRSPDQSTLDLQNKILHCLRQETKLAWLIDLNRRRIWVWQGEELPIIFSEIQYLPDLDLQLELTVDAVMGMVQR